MRSRVGGPAPPWGGASDLRVCVWAGVWFVVGVLHVDAVGYSCVGLLHCCYHAIRVSGSFVVGVIMVCFLPSFFL